MSDEIRKLKERTERAHRNTVAALVMDLGEAQRRMVDANNPRRAQDTALFERILALLVRADIAAFNAIVDSKAVRDAVDQVSKGGSDLRREGKKIGDIAKDIAKWSKRIEQAGKIVEKLIKLA